MYIMHIGEIIMKKIKIFEAFAGIGAQSAAFKKLNLDYEVVGISEWFINALLAYDAIHHYNEKFECNLTIQQQRQELSKFKFSKDSVRECDLSKLKDAEIEDLYRAHIRTKNQGSITDINLSHLDRIDMFVYSFPCQDLSTGGKTQGMSKGSGTRSGLLWEIERILIDLKKHNKLPKYLLLENVKALNAPSNREDFNQWKSFLESIGYINEDCTVLDAQNFGIPQHRERCFMLSQLNEKGNIISNYHQKLEKVRLAYNNKKKPIDYFIKLSPELHRDEQDAAQVNPTPSREEMWRVNKREVIDENLLLHTIHCNLDRSNTSAMFKYNGLKGESYRLLTMREAFLLMGFTEQQYEKVKALGLSYRKINKLIGNSIVVDVLAAQFEVIFNKGD